MSTAAQTPYEIAREVFRRLATNRVPPTPENFQTLYHQIAGTTPGESFPERELRTFVAGLPRDTPEQQRIARRLEGAVAERNWEGFSGRLRQIFQDASEAQPPWAGLIRELLVQIERRHATVSRARKQEALDHVLQGGQADASQLFLRLQGLVKGWSHEALSESVIMVDAPSLEQALSNWESTSSVAVPLALEAGLGNVDQELRELLAQILEDAVGTLLSESPELHDSAQKLAVELRAPRERFEVGGFAERLRAFTYRIEWLSKDQAGVRQALVRLLQLVVENVNDLVVDDTWLQGQVGQVLELAGKPFNRDTIDELNRRLRDVIIKQGVLKKSLVDAQDRLKSMLAGFVDHLSDIYDTTGEYRDRMERCGEQVVRAGSLADLSSVIEEIVRETRNMQYRAASSRDELHGLRAKVVEANAEVERLQHELDAASNLVRHDPLTGALNRKGLDEALEREINRAQRNDRPLCLALIDVDNFKQLNDRLGHRAGDDALVHLAHVISDAIRPQDSMARYGGEEFVVLLPDTARDAGVAVVQRLQRELTKRFFLHDQRKLLITFSAGVAELVSGEPVQRALDRADEAMYRAKRAGKNRVFEG
ncbi:GGDEF domain-containing protein [Niveibacterium sp. SC-1]|uniref:GGDEF domain-containing protein n=1 Tax=Niveibacterium sp. SC-1 TaxID=3135646 RepID=UPI00311D42B7